jgi:hypothetical protein
MLYRATGRNTEASREVETIVRLSPTREGLDTAAQLWTMFGEPEKAKALKRAEKGR